MPAPAVSQPTPFTVQLDYDGKNSQGEDVHVVEIYGIDPGCHVATPQTGEELVSIDRLWQTFKDHETQTSQRPAIPVKPAKGQSVSWPKVAEKIKRPNGEWYWTRTMRIIGEEVPDVAFVRRALSKRRAILMKGPPGTGKTALMEAAVGEIETVPDHNQTLAADFTGGWVQMPDGTYVYVAGPAPSAMIRGIPLFVDEIALIDPRELAVLYPAMDGRGFISMTDNPAYRCTHCDAPRIQHAADGFIVVGACNPNVPGANMSEALTSRFALQMTVETDYDLARKMGVQNEIIVVSRNLERTREKDGSIIRSPQMRDLINFMDNVDAVGLHAALCAFVSDAEGPDKEEYAKALSSSFGVKVTELLLGPDKTD